MVTGLMSVDFYGYRQCVLGFIRVQTCLCVGLWTPVGWKTEFVSGNCGRST
jgi:hypothetical protein